MKKDSRKLPKLTRLLNRALLISLLVCGFFLFEGQAQQKKKTTNVTDSCEIVTANLGNVLNTLSKIKDDENYLIIIGKSAANVKSIYVRRQVEDVLKYFNLGEKFDVNKVVLGFDKSSNKFSQIQFFVGGKLVGEINYHPKAKLCFSDGWTF